jgi:Ca2+-binding EF-hand superfamily protein
MEVKSARLKSMMRTAEIADALKSTFLMEFDKNTNGKISKENKDLAEMVRLCGENGYDICITFKEYKTYRINDYVRAYYPMTHDVLKKFGEGSLTLEGKTQLEDWFDEVDEQTKGYVNESEVPKRRNKNRK